MPDDPRLEPDEGAPTLEETDEDDEVVASSDPATPGLAATVVQKPEQPGD